MCEVIKQRPNEIIIFNNFRALEECIAENHFTDITVFTDNLKGVDAIARGWAE